MVLNRKMLVRPSSFTSMLRSSIKTNPKSDNEHNSRVLARTDDITPKPMPKFQLFPLCRCSGDFRNLIIHVLIHH